MSQQLISRSPDLKRLRDEGYAVEVRSNHLLIHAVPYVNARCQVLLGVLVSELTLAGDATLRPATHLVHFIGEHPCTRDGVEIVQIKHESGTSVLAGDLVAQHSFSNKPADGYCDYYEKMTRYIEILGGPARAIDPAADARSFRPVESGCAESVFAYLDTASSRAGIQAISERLAPQRVAIVGLGGTGSYVLDMVAKTPAREIHLFDDDLFLQHNAFRSPGAASLDDLALRADKVSHFQAIYARMRTGIVAHRMRIGESNVSELQGFDFVFLCVDKGGVRKLIVEALLASRTPFVDAGMGVEITDQTHQLWAICRVTSCTAGKSDHVAARIPMAESPIDDAYTQNIQIADLNALNAALAVIKWKKLCGFYEDVEREHHSTYSTNFNLLTSDETVG